MRATTFGLAATFVAFGASAAEPLVSPEWLAENLEQPNLVVLDVRNRIDGGSPAVHRAGHIPGAIYSDYANDGWRVTVDGVPALLPPADQLEALIGGLGIDEGDHVVIVHSGVNATDFGSAARVYFTLDQAGHDAISILDGGYAAWTADANRPVETGQRAITPVSYEIDVEPQGIWTADDVVATLGSDDHVLLDARPLAQFDGHAKHPLAQRPGHIPGATHFDQSTWFEPESATLRPLDEVVAGLPPAVAEGETPIVSYCNTGHWAVTNWFMLTQVLGRSDVEVYDGSMVDWTADEQRPVATTGS
ncbi:MAG: sulfurtransferase [Pseudomonadota bacterium]